MVTSMYFEANGMISLFLEERRIHQKVRSLITFKHIYYKVSLSIISLNPSKS